MDIQRLNIKLPITANKVTQYNDLMSGYWHEWIYNEMNGDVLTYKTSNGYWEEATYDNEGKQLTFSNHSEYWGQAIYDKSGNILTYNDGNTTT
jgi:hypothetical protein